ncbi:preprotein translocase subunit SecG [Weissella koreensis]|uniref:Protein-export membrane protein SecG n=1 Tax=Weissella koreensis TaxID=165096 RepID=A0A7H1MMK0_9LACO|nr:preprotein translocase subunit SecG [Weissella koreensis]AEJ23858.1 SecG [Weissella koreensis KACC 15510]AVH75484.1 preprotein translocase subunit SecG [Weissella koreensis]EJF34463.1 Sec family type I general secretory protein SecG [Weissella koreensis KCTC 3621]MCZ9311535.1 preprotein translocase subunit SecG [Weissella koreensis]QGN20707.1 preprotein translocase subunit SecG [Weissella koreensis]
MYNALLTAMIVVGILIIIAVLMQPSKQQDALSALSGGGGDLFATQKARGFEAVMQRATTVLGAIWFLLGLALVYLSAH